MSNVHEKKYGTAQDGWMTRLIPKDDSIGRTWIYFSIYSNGCDTQFPHAAINLVVYPTTSCITKRIQY